MCIYLNLNFHDWGRGAFFTRQLYLTTQILQLNRSPPKILVLDLSDSASIPQKCQEAVGLYGRIDILVNNAGVSSRGCVLDTDLSVDRRVMEVNFFGTVAVTKG